jgi:ParB family chromosome partitioning protein
LKRLTDAGLTHEQAAVVGRSRSAGEQRLRLLNPTEPVQQMLMVGDIDTIPHCRRLDSAQHPERDRDRREKLSAGEVERLVARAGTTTVGARRSKGRPAAHRTGAVGR